MPTDDECNAWPFWEYHPQDEHVIKVLTSEQVLTLPQEAIVRPLRLPDMNERGEVAAANMTAAHFERIHGWQSKCEHTNGKWTTQADDDNTMAFVERDGEEWWRPAIFAQLDNKLPNTSHNSMDPDLDIDHEWTLTMNGGVNIE